MDRVALDQGSQLRPYGLPGHQIDRRAEQVLEEELQSEVACRRGRAVEVDELNATIERLKAMSDGQRHAGVCPARSHAECPSFHRLLHAAAANALPRAKRVAA
jgi:hypothetical protein